MPSEGLALKSGPNGQTFLGDLFGFWLSSTLGIPTCIRESRILHTFVDTCRMSALSGKAEKAAEKAQKIGEGKAAAKSKTEKTQTVGEGRAGVAFNPEIKAAPAGCTNAVCGVVTSVEALEKLVAKKKQFLVAVDVGEEELVKVATLLAVAEGQRVVVALEGSFVGESAVAVKDVGGHVTTGPDGHGPTVRRLLVFPPEDGGAVFAGALPGETP